MLNKIAALVFTASLAGVAHAEFHVDYGSVTLAMYSTYMSYENGVAAMKGAEDQCWQRVKADQNKERAVLCLASGMTGVLIEESFALQEGRQAAGAYNAKVAGDRWRAEYKRNGITEQFEKDGASVVGNMGNILGGLVNAGMR